MSWWSRLAGLWRRPATSAARRREPARRPRPLPAEPGAADYLLAQGALVSARREVLRRELMAVVALVGGRPEHARCARLRELLIDDETLAAMLIVVAADPRVEFVRMADHEAAAMLMRAVNDLRALE